MKCVFVALTICVGFAQTITTVVGTGEPGFGGDGGPAKSAQLNGQGALALDAPGNLYLNDDINIRIRKVTPSGIITTVAGTGEISSTVAGPATQTGFLSIYSFSVLPDGTIYVGDSDGLQKIDTSGNLSYLINDGSVPGIRISPQGVFYTSGITVISRLNPDYSQTVIAGSELGDSGDGTAALNALFYVTDYTTDLNGDIYILDGVANRVRKFTPGGNINTIAGNGTNDFTGDGGPGYLAQLSNPSGIAVDVSGNVYISDTGNRRVRKVTTDGTIQTIAGTGDGSMSGDGGPALQATFNAPSFLAVGCTALYVSDSNSVRAIELKDPLIAQRGITNPATGALTLRAGANFQINGCNLAGGTTVTLNGTPVTIVSATSTQLIATVPVGFPSGTTNVTVIRDGISATATAGTIVE